MDKLSFPGIGLSFNIDGEAFNVFGISIKWYAVLIAAGVLLAIIYVEKRSRSFGLHPDRFFDVVIGGILLGMVGARVFYVIFAWDEFKDDLFSIFNTRNGGLAIYGGIIGGVLAGILICKIRNVKILPTMDLAGLGFLIGQGIGRWGNFTNMEAFGSNTNLPWGMTSNTITNYLEQNKTALEASGVTINSTLPVHPCFLYESLWCFLGFILLHIYSKKRRFDGEIFLLYISWYSLGRFFIEGLRTDSLLAGNFRVSQILSALLFMASLIIWTVIRSKIKRENDEDYMKIYVNTDESKTLLKKIDDELASEKKKEDKKNSDSENMKKVIVNAKNESMDIDEEEKSVNNEKDFLDKSDSKEKTK